MKIMIDLELFLSGICLPNIYSHQLTRLASSCPCHATSRFYLINFNYVHKSKEIFLNSFDEGLT